MLLWLVVPMAATGYLLQTATGELTTRILVVVHLVTSGVFVLGYLAHFVMAMRQKLAAPS